MSQNITLCPECGWTGADSDLEVSGDELRCPTCECVMRRD